MTGGDLEKRRGFCCRCFHEIVRVLNRWQLRVGEKSLGTGSTGCKPPGYRCWEPNSGLVQGSLCSYLLSSLQLQMASPFSQSFVFGPQSHCLGLWVCSPVYWVGAGLGSEASCKLVPPQLFSFQLCPDGVWVLLNSRVGFPLYPWACKAKLFFHNGENLQVWSTPLCPDDMTWSRAGPAVCSGWCLSDRAVAGKGQTSDSSSC